MQVWAFEAGEDAPLLAWEATLGEAVHAVAVGAVLQPGRADVVCCTFAGRVAAFSRATERSNPDQAARGAARGSWAHARWKRTRSR